MFYWRIHRHYWTNWPTLTNPPGNAMQEGWTFALLPPNAVLVSFLLLAAQFTPALAHPLGQAHEEQQVRHYHRRLMRAREEAVMGDILRRLGMDRPPDTRRFNVTTEKMKAGLQAYQAKLDELNGSPGHELYPDKEFLAKHFHQLNTGKYFCATGLFECQNTTTNTHKCCCC